MDPHISAWLNLVLRWVHLIAGAAWIGASFYFNWLNNHLRPPREPSDEVSGEVWSVHGGAFYLVEKFRVAPARLPETLHWFKWEAYLTWMSGFCLLVLVYYMGADVYLIDPSVADITPTIGVLIGLGSLVGSWIVYDLLCKSPLVEKTAPFAVVTFALATALAFGLTQVFSSRAAYMHVGAVLGTIMAANVFFVIIPFQRVMVDQMIRGEEPDGSKGRAGALRSLHNNYMTLPVLFIMVSNHFPMTYGNASNWAILAGLAIVGGLTRHHYNLKGQGQENAWLLPASAVGLIALAFVTAPSPRTASAQGDATTPTSVSGEHVSFAVVAPILQEKCAVCHSANPTQPGFAMAPLGLLLDTPEQIQAAAARIDAQAVQSQIMPLANLTGMTAEERALLGRWIREGARIR